MNERQIETFLTVADCQSFVKAAHILYITQPAVTQHIHSLEKELGFRLFERDSHGVVLTPAGSHFKLGVVAMRESFQRTLLECQRISEGSLSMTICYLGFTNVHILPKILRQIYSDYPDFSITHKRISPRDIPAVLQSHNPIMVMSPYDIVGDDYQSVFIPLFKDRHYCVMNANSSLAGKKEFQICDFEGQILYLPRPEVRPEHIKKLVARLDSEKVNYELRVEDGLESVITRVLTTKCVAVLPGYTRPASEEIICIPIQDEVFMDYGIFYNKKQKLTAAEKLFVDTAREVFC